MRRLAVFLAGLWGAAAFLFVPAQAGGLREFNDAVSLAYAHQRGAVFYLRTGNSGLAAFELEAMRHKWRRVVERFADDPPDAFAEDGSWKATLGRVARRLEAALAAANAGDVETAREELRDMRVALAELRRRNNVTTFADCVDEMNAAMDRLWRYRSRLPNFDEAREVDGLKAAVAVVTYLYRRCRARAPARYRDDPEFNRLFDGSIAALARLWPAIAGRNRQALVNLLREIRSFDRMIFLRYG